MSLDKFLALANQLYPRGRAFKMPASGFLEKLHRALAISENQCYQDVISLLNNILPDNPNFSADDATAWEKRLGLIVNEDLNLDDRKLAIARKMNHPGTIPTRQAWQYLQLQLQNAGFDVYVFENRFSDGLGGYTTMNPLTLTGGVGAYEIQHGDNQHGDNQHGGGYGNIVVNHIDENKDKLFGTGTNLKSTIFIGGNPLGTFADIPEIRKNEFRQLILKIKPTPVVGYLFVNYI